MAVLYTNNAVATLASSISNSATTIALTGGQGALFPNPTGGDVFYATLVDTAGNLEIVRCTARSTDSLTVVRAQEGTTARAYTAGDKLECRVTAAGLANKLDKDTGGTIAGAITVQADSAFTSTGGLGLPSGTTAQRGSPARPTIRYNSEQATWEGYNGSTWGSIGGGGVPVRQQFTATASQTTFTITGGYTPNQVDVFLNGVKLLNGTDVTVSSGTSVVLAAGATVGDIVDVVGITSYSIASVVAKSGDTMTGFLTLSADPTNVLHAATKQYVDNGVAGRVSNTADQTVSGVKTFTDARFTDGNYRAYVTATNAVFLFDANDYMTYDRTGNNWSIVVNNVTRATVDSTGNFTASGNVTAYSDERLKKDWTSISGDFVTKLAGVKSGTYTRIDNDLRQAGVSAQSLQEVLPEAVQEDVEGMLSVAYGNAALVAAIELAKEVVDLKKRLEVLEAK